MREFYAKDYNIVKGTDITVQLATLLSYLRGESGEKRLIFEKGEYYLTSKLSTNLEVNVTNTIGIKEWEKGEEKRKQKTPILLLDTDDLTIDFNNSTLIIQGVVTNMIISNCKNIKIENVEIKVENPNLHEIKVVKKTGHYIDYEIDSESILEKIDGKLCFTGCDYVLPLKYKVTKTWWVGDVKRETPDKIVRSMHPLLGSIVKQLDKKKIRAYYINTSKFSLGERFYLYDVRRKNVGIFVEDSENITLYNVKQRFNYSLAIVCQHTNNITLEKLDFTPCDDRKMISIADFIQICMCSGKVVIKDSKFVGAGDDCLNVHGFHFKIVKREGNDITIRFMHPQSYGFLAFDIGDEIAYVDKNSLITKGTSKVLNVKQINPYDICLTVDKVIDENLMVENLTKNPDLEFKNNYLNRIITRGILVTTRGKVEIINNIFNNNSMSGILISDDANNWYESSSVENVKIEGNRFNNSQEYDILIKPENNKFEGYVHKNIEIVNNTFSSKIGGGIFVKDSDNVVIKDNIIEEKDFKIINKNSNIIE